MEFQVEIWLRGDNHATSETITPVAREPRAWTDADVVAVLEGMLRALERAKHPEAAADRPVALRGFSWIVSPFETGGVVIALELTLGAVVAGPFDVPEGELSAAIARVLAGPARGGHPHGPLTGFHFCVAGHDRPHAHGPRVPAIGRYFMRPK